MRSKVYKGKKNATFMSDDWFLACENDVSAGFCR